MSRSLSLALILFVSAVRLGLADRPPVTAFAMDWDDNIVCMPTQVMVWDRAGRREKAISTAQFALVRQQMGKPGEWKGFEFRDDPKTGSLRYFGDESERGKAFAKDVVAALSAPPATWKGPSWAAFARAMSAPETARRTSIITARLHSPHSIWEGIRELQRRGLIRCVPTEPAEDPAELDRSSLSIFPVAYPKMLPEFRGPPANPSAAKARVMEMLLDRLDREPVAPDTRPVTDQEGTVRRPMHLWGFSDDDFGNFQKAVDVLSERVKQGSWARVKIVVFFTGQNHPTQRPHAVVLTAHGPRDPLPGELAESGTPTPGPLR